MLDEDYRPIGAPDLDPVRPVNPRLLKAFLYACARYSARQSGMVQGVVPPASSARPEPKNRAQRRAAARRG